MGGRRTAASDQLSRADAAPVYSRCRAPVTDPSDSAEQTSEQTKR